MSPLLIILGIILIGAATTALIKKREKRYPIVDAYSAALETLALRPIVEEGSRMANDPLKTCVERFYVFDKETEYILHSGAELQDGMTVLIDSFELRVDINQPMTLITLDRALEMNRWCTIRDVLVLGRTVRFNATYVDGTKRERTLSIHHSWIARKRYRFEEAKTEKLNVLAPPYGSFSGRTEIPE